MCQIILECNGKINLGLDVINKRKDGYHNIKTIMQEIELQDIVTMEKIDDGFIIESNKEEVPLNEENIAYKVWYIMKEKFKLQGGLRIYIEKNIPVAAGLAGGSTNGAGVLKGINKLWNLGLSHDELRLIASKLGADIPFCLTGGTVLAEGIGDRFTKVLKFSNVDILLVNPNFGVSTEVVYKGLSEYNTEDKMKDLVENIDSNNLELLRGKLYNKLEENVLVEYPEIEKIKEEMKKYGAVESLMSGSGPTVFGIFENPEKLDFAYGKFKEKFNEYMVIKTKTL